MGDPIYIYPNPDGEGFLVMQMTDQEAFVWDCEHYGIDVALANWQEIFDWRAMGRPIGLHVPDGRAG